MYVSISAYNLEKYILTDSCAYISTHMTSIFIHLNIKLFCFFMLFWVNDLLSSIFYFTFASGVNILAISNISVINEDRTSGSFDLNYSFL